MNNLFYSLKSTKQFPTSVKRKIIQEIVLKGLASSLHYPRYTPIDSLDDLFRGIQIKH